jgi:hypothetical protein
LTSEIEVVFNLADKNLSNAVTINNTAAEEKTGIILWGGEKDYVILPPGLSNVHHSFPAAGLTTVNIKTPAAVSWITFKNQSTPVIQTINKVESTSIKLLGWFDTVNGVVTGTGLFMNQTKLSDFKQGFKFNVQECTSAACLFSGCSALSDYPEDIFSPLVNNTSFAEVFRGTAITIVKLNTFKYNLKTRSFARTFAGCKQLTEIAVSSIDKAVEFNDAGAQGKVSVFDYSARNAKDGNAGLGEGMGFEGCFSDCTVLQAIPEWLFWYRGNVAAQYPFASSIFNGCTALTAIPQIWGPGGGSFGHFYNAFWNCGNIASVHPDLMQNVGKYVSWSYTGGFSLALANCKLQSLPAKIGHDMPNCEDYAGAFMRLQAGSIPYNIFWTNRAEAVNFESVFSGSKVQGEIPACLFKRLKWDAIKGDYCKNPTLPYLASAPETDMQHVGDNDLEPIKLRMRNAQSMHFKTALSFLEWGGTIPPNLLKGVTVLPWQENENGVMVGKDYLSIEGMFQGNASTATNGLLKDVSAVVGKIDSLFKNAALTESIENIFGNNTYPKLFSANSAFEGCAGITGNALPLINGKLSGITSHAGMFRGCTGLSDYALIPDEWK